MTETAQLAQVVSQMLEWAARLDPQAAGAPKGAPDRAGGCSDPIAGTPYHKNVAVRLTLVSGHEAAVHQSQFERIHKIAAGQQLEGSVK